MQSHKLCAVLLCCTALLYCFAALLCDYTVDASVRASALPPHDMQF